MRFYKMGWVSGEERYADAMVQRASYRGLAQDRSGPHDLRAHDFRDARRVHPLVIEWQWGSDEVAEFTWASIDDPVVWADIARELLDRFSGATAMPIEMVQDPKLQRPSRVTKRTRRRVWLPYDGPELVELVTTRWVDLDPRSTTSILDTCSCGYERWDPVGHERRETVQVAPDHWVTERFPRDPAAGLAVRAADLAGDSIFRIEGWHENWLMVTEPVKDLVEERRWRNVDFFEMGDVVDEP